MNCEEWSKKMLTRDEVSKIPSFSSHLEAREYFENIYGDNNFKFIESYPFNDCNNCYCYHLIFDYDQYTELKKQYDELSRLIDLIDESNLSVKTGKVTYDYEFGRQIISTEMSKILSNYEFSFQRIKIYEWGDVFVAN